MKAETEFVYCSRRDRRLCLGDIVWLELNNRTGKYYRDGDVSEEESQGLFPFGRTCAAKTAS